MFSVDVRTGKLLEVRVGSPFTMDEASQLFKEIYKKGPRGGGVRVIVDMRQMRLLDPDVIDLMTGFMQKDNPLVERNAFLLPDGSALLQIQSDRMLKQVGSASRRNFRDREQAESWLAELCTPAEKARLKQFLDEG